ncbi:ABC-F family ATP-binding cassette domain-containing protein [Listeria fleischmannii]|uniref:ABC-F family ATP-binding cassette domain-containing protein n=1 Tax=Listeria fleischmannii TaxID=1069827 RepID=A0A841YHK3_9LIST|nr:ABC-F family ATP-binding cassette domain-containing protein [Listeria fleischmannii]MBC1399604.1 ABC-F family ATP-binding cassette domain-containing protein [Listeria fleischmannii]MBC1427883.1 ABC-F family ATP-binding cassette domain-containing protein [Listeria fleischmannii]
MKQLKVIDMTKTFGEKTLFDHVDVTISEGERIGLIGVNGTGKSTFLDCIAGISSGDTGEILKPSDYTIGFLRQNPPLDEKVTVLEAIFAGETRNLRAVREYERVLLAMEEEQTEAIHEHFTRAQAEMDATNAWDLNTEAKTILDRLGVKNLKAKISELSGGERKRAALAQVLIETPDLLILDEPTNHLDFTTIKWLEDYLTRFKGAVLVVTHDRYFLDRITNHIIELDYGKLYRYVGNYESFMESKAIRLENEVRESEKNRNLYRKELAWMRRGAKARSTKQKARKDRFVDLEDKVKTKTNDAKLELDFKTSRLGNDVFLLEHVSKRFSEKVILDDFNLLIKPGERLGITGKNGTGKSTLLNMLTGQITPDTGEITTGQTVNIGYYTQQNTELDPDKRMITYLQEIGNEVKTTQNETISVSAMLERFLFPKEAHGKLIGSLSGGEKRRLFLLKVLMSAPNVLLLDEPTNDLDTETLTVLEDYLETFNGTVITVSHDRYFLDKIASKLLVFKGQGITEEYYGMYSEYLEQAADETPKKVAPSKPKEEPEVKKEKVKFSYMEKKEWAGIEAAIAENEAQIATLNEELQETGADFTKAGDLSAQIETAGADLLHLYERYEYLSQFAN